MPITSRNFYRNVNHLEVDLVKLFGSVVIGSSGAVTSFQGGGIASVVKESTAGQYTITLSDRFAFFLMGHFRTVGASALAVAAIQVLETPATFQADIKSDGAITIQCLDFAGAAVNPASGAELMFELVMRQSKIGRYDTQHS